jgi:hypothetical protein
MSRTHNSSSQLDIADTVSVAYMPTVNFEIATSSKYSPGCLPFFDGGIPRYFTNITKKVDVGSLSGSAPEIKL